MYPVDGRDSAERGLGCTDNRHLNYFAESTAMNVGGLYRNDKVSSPLMSATSVGAVIVLGVRESRIQGEGPQSVGKPEQTSRMLTR
jgi:hypothetical protein